MDSKREELAPKVRRMRRLDEHLHIRRRNEVATLISGGSPLQIEVAVILVSCNFRFLSGCMTHLGTCARSAGVLPTESALEAMLW